MASYMTAMTDAADGANLLSLWNRVYSTALLLFSDVLSYTRSCKSVNK